jgi:hypothetical protein
MSKQIQRLLARVLNQRQRQKYTDGDYNHLCCTINGKNIGQNSIRPNTSIHAEAAMVNSLVSCPASQHFKDTGYSCGPSK